MKCEKLKQNTEMELNGIKVNPNNMKLTKATETWGQKWGNFMFERLSTFENISTLACVRTN